MSSKERKVQQLFYVKRQAIVTVKWWTCKYSQKSYSESTGLKMIER
jgi:hypothetical protein